MHPVGPIVHAGPIFYPAAAAGDLLRLFRDWCADASDDVTALVNLTTAPPLPVIPEAWHGQKVAVFVAVSPGSVEEADARVKPFREVAEPIADLLGPMPYNVMQTLLDPLWPKGIQAYFKGTNLESLDDELIERLIERHRPRLARRPRSTCTRWAAPSPGTPPARRSRTGRCRS